MYTYIDSCMRTLPLCLSLLVGVTSAGPPRMGEISAYSTQYLRTYFCAGIALSLFLPFLVRV